MCCKKYTNNNRATTATRSRKNREMFGCELVGLYRMHDYIHFCFWLFVRLDTAIPLSQPASQLAYQKYPNHTIISYARLIPILKLRFLELHVPKRARECLPVCVCLLAIKCLPEHTNTMEHSYLHCGDYMYIYRRRRFLKRSPANSYVCVSFFGSFCNRQRFSSACVCASPFFSFPHKFVQNWNKIHEASALQKKLSTSAT